MDEKTDQKKVQKVVSGTAVAKDKTLWQKFLDLFIPEDVDNIGEYLVMDVLVPTVKRAIVDSVNMALFGEVSSAGRKIGGQRVTYRTDYSGISTGKSAPVRTRQATYDYNNIIFDNRGDAEAVLSTLDDLMSEYGLVSVLDLYSASGLDCDYTAQKWGWYDIRAAEILRTRDGGYMLKFPKAQPLK